MYLIGITGSIASGKSTLSSWLTEQGHVVIDSDLITHQLLENDDDLWAQLVSHFGDGILDPDGSICRSCLASEVFSDKEEREFLEETIHPLIKENLLKQIVDLSRETDRELIFVEATLLFQSGFDDIVDETWLISAPFEKQQQRLIQDRHYSEEEATIRIQAIPPLSDEQLARCERIDNSGDFLYTVKQAQALLHRAQMRAQDCSGNIG